MSAVLTLFAGIVCFVSPVFAKDWEVTINVPYPDKTFEIQVDGKVMPIVKDGDKYKVTVQDESQFITAIQFFKDGHEFEIYDDSGNRTTDTAPYPEHMAVWEINKYYEADPEDNNKVKLKNLTVPEDRLAGFDDILGYEGFALKPPEKRIQPGNQLDMTDGGLRVSLSMPKSIKQNGLMDGDDQLYSIKEYGLLHIFSRNWNAQSKDHMTIGEELVEKSASYRAGSFDNELTAKSTDTKSVFSNYLYNVVDFDTNKYFRAYVKIHRNATDEDLYLYGPIVGRNPYYVAKSYESTIATNPNKYNDDMKAYVSHVVSAVEGTGGSGTSGTVDEINIFFIGDSIMMGQTLRSGSTTQNKPQDYTQVSKPPSVLIGNAISGRLNAYHTKQGDGTKVKVNCTLIANGGATYSEPGINRINMPMLANRAITQGVTPDYIFLLAGVNDWAYADQGEGETDHSAWFGNHENGKVLNEFGHDYCATDGKSYAIGFDTTIKTLLDEYGSSGTKIIVCSPLRAFWKPSGPGTTTVNASTGKTLSEYSYLQNIVSGYYNETLDKNVYFMDLYELICSPMGLPRSAHSVPEDCSNFWSYFPDGIHPNQSGYNKACQALLNAMHDTTGKDGKKLIPDAEGNW